MLQLGKEGGGDNQSEAREGRGGCTSRVAQHEGRKKGEGGASGDSQWIGGDEVTKSGHMHMHVSLLVRLCTHTHTARERERERHVKPSSTGTHTHIHTRARYAPSTSSRVAPLSTPMMEPSSKKLSSLCPSWCTARAVW